MKAKNEGGAKMNKLIIRLIGKKEQVLLALEFYVLKLGGTTTLGEIVGAEQK